MIRYQDLSADTLTADERVIDDEHIAEGQDHEDAMLSADLVRYKTRTYVQITPQMVRQRESEIEALAKEPKRWLNAGRDLTSAVLPPFSDFCDAVQSLWDDRANNVQGDIGGFGVDSPSIRELQVIARKVWGHRFYKQVWGCF